MVLIPKGCKEVRVLRWSVFIAPAPNDEVSWEILKRRTGNVSGAVDWGQKHGHVQSDHEYDLECVLEHSWFKVESHSSKTKENLYSDSANHCRDQDLSKLNLEGGGVVVFAKWRVVCVLAVALVDSHLLLKGIISFVGRCVVCEVGGGLVGEAVLDLQALNTVGVVAGENTCQSD